MKRCGMLVYLGLGEVRNCHKKASAIFDAGKPTGFPVCEEHSKVVHPLRLTLLAADLGKAPAKKRVSKPIKSRYQR